MAYDEGVAQRIREAAEGQPCIEERRMFGGIAFLAGGHMFLGVLGETLMVRVGPDAYAAALKRPHARVMDFTGKPLTGYLFVDPPGFAEDEALRDWMEASLAFVRTLPPKLPKPPRAKKTAAGGKEAGTGAKPRRPARRPAR